MQTIEEYKEYTKQLEGEVKTLHDAYNAITIERNQLVKRIKELEAENRWHRCDKPNDEGFYDLPPENGEYIVEFVSGLGKVTICAAGYYADYDDWDCPPFNSKARQWREMPKAPEVT